jgi:hypothetical protein
MARQFTYRNLIRGFLELENLLVDKVTFLVGDDIRVHGTRVRSLLPRLWAAAAASRQGQAREATIDSDMVHIFTALASEANDGSL